MLNHFKISFAKKEKKRKLELAQKNGFKLMIQMNLSVHTHTHTQTSCAVEEKRLAAGILDDHDGSIIVLQAAGDLSNASLQDGDVLCLHCLTVR